MLTLLQGFSSLRGGAKFFLDRPDDHGGGDGVKGLIPERGEVWGPIVSGEFGHDAEELDFKCNIMPRVGAFARADPAQLAQGALQRAETINITNDLAQGSKDLLVEGGGIFGKHRSNAGRIVGEVPHYLGDEAWAAGAEPIKALLDELGGDWVHTYST